MRKVSHEKIYKKFTSKLEQRFRVFKRLSQLDQLVRFLAKSRYSYSACCNIHRNRKYEQEGHWNWKYGWKSSLGRITGNYRFVYIPMPFMRRSRIQIQTKCKMSMLFLKQNVLFFTMVLLFLLILCTNKWKKLFTPAVLAFKLYFKHIRLN